MTDYILPTSTNRAENTRLDRQHVLLVKTFGLIRAPIDKNAKLTVLDIACGTGSWSVDFAQNYPNADVLGFDKSPYDAWKTAPSRCTFTTGDMADDKFWSSLPKYDFIHARFITAACRDWNGLVKHCFAQLKPHGWLELQDFHTSLCVENHTHLDPCHTIRWGETLRAGFAKAGLEMNGIQGVDKSMRLLGFENIRSDDFKMMFKKSKDPAEQEGLENLRHGIHGFANTLFTKVLGMSDDEEVTLSNATIDELDKGLVSSFLPMMVTYGQKPL